METLRVAPPSSTSDLPQLQEKVALQDQQLGILNQELEECQQLVKDKELARKTLELQVDRLHSGLRLEIALKEKALLDASQKSLILEKVEKLHNACLSDQAQDLASHDFTILQEQELRKAQDNELSLLQKELEQLRSEKDALKEQNTKLQADFQNYKEQEKGRWEEWRQVYLQSPAFAREFVRRIVGALNHSVSGVLRQLKEGGYLPKEPPLSFINRRRLNEELPSDLKGPFPNV